MDTQPLKLQVDSKQAQADLAALAKALDTAGSAVERMQTKFASGMSGTDAALNKSMKSMEKFAEVATLLGKVKISGEPAQQLREFAQALNTLSRAKAIDAGQITNIKTLTRTLADLKVPAGAARLTQFLQAVGSARAPSEGNVTRLKQMLKLLASYQPTAATRNTEALARFFNTISNIRVPSEAALNRLQKLFTILGEAKAVPGAAKIAADLDHIAMSAARAGLAFKDMPGRLNAFAPAAERARKGASGLHGEIAKAPGHSERAGKGFFSLGNAVSELSGRFRIGYQAGTLFSAFFASFTVGQFLKGIYETGIELAKLQKALLFSTGSFKGAADAMNQYVGMAQELGLNIDKTSESYGRFTISAKASGMNLDSSNKVFHAVAQTLQIIGASSEQTTLAFYGLTQMMQKGKVMSEEFNRQIGEQIPGNAVIGARALSMLENKYVSVAEFFKRMSQGQVLSPKFVPAYANALQEQFGDLYPLLNQRPDVALTRLANSFIMFKKAVGDAGFMAAIGKEFTHLRGLLVEGDGAAAHLRPNVAALAKELGKNLGQMAHVAGEGIGFLLKHIPELIMALKALAALKIGTTFMEWGSKASSFAGALITTSGATKAFAAKSAVETAASGAAGAEALVDDAAMMGGLRRPMAPRAAKRGLGGMIAAMMGVSGAAGAAAEVVHFGSVNAAGFGSSTLASGGLTGVPGSNPKFGPPLPPNHFGSNAGLMAAMNPGMFGAPSGAMKPGAIAGFAAEAVATEAKVGRAAFSLKGLGSAVAGFGAFLPGIGTLALAAGVALAAFSDHITEFKTSAGNAVKVSDLVGGATDSMTTKVAKWGAKLFGFSGDFDGMQISWGKVVALLMASIETVVGGLFTLASTLGKTLGTVIGNIIDVLAGLTVSAYKAMHGDLGGAKDAFVGIGKNITESWKSLGSQISDDFKVFDTARNYRQIVEGGMGRADARAATSGADLASQEANADTEAKLQARQKALADLQAAGELQGLQARANLADTTVPTLKDAIKAFADSASASTQAATTTAAAASTMAGAAQTSAASAVTLKGIPTPPAEIAKAIANASKVTGVDSGLLTAIAFRESRFNPLAHADGSSARGLMQFTAGPKGTGQQYGITDSNYTDPTVQAIGAANYARHNADVLKNGLGRDATGGELYMSHFLDGGNAVRLIKAMQANPNASFAQMFPQAAKANPFTQKLSLKEAYDNLTSTVQGGTAEGLTSGAGMGQLTSMEGTSLTEKFELAQKRVAALTAQTNPGEAAASKLTETAASIMKLRDDNQKLMAANLPSIATPEQIAKLVALEKRLTQEAADAVNPISKEVRLAGEANDIAAMRLKGMTNEADFKQQLNTLYEQGYDITSKDILASKDAFLASKKRTEQLAAETALLTARNQAEIAGIARTGSAQQVGVARLVDSGYKDGTLQQKFAQARADGRLGTFQQQAAVEDRSRRADVAASRGAEISEAAATARLDPSTKAYRDNFKSYLKDITGVQSDSLDVIAAHASAADVAMAKSYADLKQKLDNPPGFQKWADGLEPLAKRMEDIKANFAESLSGAITDALTGDKVDWNALLKNTWKQVMKAQVDTALGGVIGFLTGKKPQKPEDIVAAAATTQAGASDTFSTGAQTFSGAVDSFAQAVQAVISAPAGGSASAGLGSVGSGSAGGFDFGSLASNDNGLGDLGGFNFGSIAANDNGGYTPMDVMSNDLTPMSVPTSADFLPGLSLPSNFMPADSGAGGLGGLLGKGGGLSGLMSIAGIGGALYNLFHKKKAAPVDPLPINGVIGESRPVSVTGTEVAAHGNPIGMLLSSIVGMAGGAGFGAPGGNLTSFLGAGGGMGGGGGIGSWLGRMFGGAGGGMGGGGLSSLFSMIGGMFSEGGYSNQPVGTRVMSMHAWRDAPHYSEGTSNTSGGMPAILHPNEAVIPLSRGRSIPVDLGDHPIGGQHFAMTSNITVIAPNPDAFRQSRGSIQRQTNRDMKRAAARNLTA
jgi:tape measure domain-containing protein